jgi:hypothetical protein
MYLSEHELAALAPAEQAAFESLVPTQVISNGEFNPLPQTRRQRQVEARINEIADTTSRRLGWTGGASCAPPAAWRPPSSR